MIYGLNFGAGPIPDDIRRKFPKTRRKMVNGKFQTFYLQGVADNVVDHSEMIILAANGHRAVDGDIIPHSGWYAVWTT